MLSQSSLISSLVDEIIPHFQGPEDLAAISKIKSTTEKASMSLERQQQLMKELVAGLAGAVSCLQEDIDRAERGEEEMIMLREALEEKENALLKLRAMEGQGELISHKMLEIEAQKQDINEQLMELKQSKLVEIPVIKHALGLYANITNLRWDYDAKTVKGYIAKTDDVKHFDIKDSENSVRVADQLWGMM